MRCRSVFYLPKPRPLNHLVGALYRGPTLVLNGALDPLNNAVARAQVRAKIPLLGAIKIYPRQLFNLDFITLRARLLDTVM